MRIINKPLHIIMQSFIVLWLGTSFLLADGSIFGFHAPLCIWGGNYDSEKHTCFYCPKGSAPLDDAFLENKKCQRNSVLGNRCPFGKEVWFDYEQYLCMYCATGYTSSYNRQCYK